MSHVHRRRRSGGGLFAAVIALACLAQFTGAPVAAAATPGISASEVKLGIVYPFGAAEARRRLGVATDPNVVDPKLVFQTLVDDQNSKGGVDGRKITPVFQVLDATGGPIPTQEQAMCTGLTQDNQVFAALIQPHTETLLRCFKDKNVATVGPSQQGGISNEDDTIFKSYPTYVSAGTMSLTTLARIFPDQLVKMGFLTKGSKVGVVAYETPAYTRALNQVLLPALAKQGFKDVQVAQMGQPVQRQADLAALTALEQGSVLRFKSAGVDKVIFFDSLGPGWQFMVAAEPQGYHPKYAEQSGDTATDLLRNAPAAQSVGAVGLSFYPNAAQGGDVATPLPLSESGTACINLLKSKGVATDNTVLPLCQQFNVFVAAMKNAGKNPTAKSFVKGYEKLGKFGSTVGMTLNFSKKNHAGAAGFRRIQYTDSCSCFQYNPTTEFPITTATGG
jgi:hypothetical protein